ncbi:MAG: DUF11 domain-containing protein [Rhodothermia bacterium]|nr:DUF11 domain-containing protein [Rhodothermia bacterium]
MLNDKRASLTDIEVLKSISNPNPVQGSQITFTVIARNRSNVTATNVTLSDRLPSGLVYVSHNAQVGSYSSSTGVWNVGTIPAGAVYSLTIRVIANTAANNCAQLISSVPLDGNSSNNNSCCPNTVQPGGSVDLTVDKTKNNDNPPLNSTFNYILKVKNQGTSPASNVVVTDQLPSGVQYVSHSATQGSFSGATWNVGTLAAGATATLTITVRRISSASIRNCMAATTTSQETSTGNNDDCTSISEIQSPTLDLRVTKSVTNINPIAGTQISYPVSVTNLSNITATDVVVRDVLPAGLVFVSANGTGNYNATTGIWTVGTVGAGQTVSITITVIANADANNCAELQSSNPADNNSANNRSCCPITVQSPPQNPDVKILKTVNNPNPAPNSQITYTITAMNIGDVPLVNLWIKDELPTGVSYVSSSANYGSYTPPNWMIPILPVGAIATLNITVTVTGTGLIQNCAMYWESTPRDTNSSNNQSCADINVQPRTTDIQVNKTFQLQPFSGGYEASFTIRVRNNGQQNATNVNVTDLLNGSFSHVGSFASQGTYVAQTGNWNVGNLLVGQEATLTILATALSSGTNCAQLATSTPTDNNAGNNQSCVNVQLPAGGGGGGSDLAINTTASTSSSAVGGFVFLFIDLLNATTSSLANAPIMTQVDLPAGLQVLQAFPSNGSYNTNSKTWTLTNSISGGGSARLILYASVVGGGISQVCATITSSPAPDPNQGNNIGCAPFVVN